jgi:tetratricopeptide (TPR) repeat protein
VLTGLRASFLVGGAIFILVSFGAKVFGAEDSYASVRQEDWSHQLILGDFYQRGEEEEHRFFEDRTRRDSDDTYSLNALADIYLRKLRKTGSLGWLDRASEAVRCSLASLPAAANVQAIMLQARVEAELHHFAKARNLAEEFLKQQPADPAGLEVLGDALLELGDYTEAAGAYEKLRALFAQEELPAEVDTRLAYLAWIRGDEGAAVEDYSRALARARSMPSGFVEMQAFCLVQLGQLSFERGAWAHAWECYTQALAILPSYYPAFEHLAELAAAEGRFPIAIDLYKQLIMRVDRPEFDQMLADLLIYLQRYGEAKPWIDAAEQSYSASVDRGLVYNNHNLVSFYCDTDPKPEAAVQVARRDLENVHSIFAYAGLGWALYRQGDYQGAAQAFDRALVFQTPSAHLYYEAGTAYFRVGELVKGRDCLQRAYALNPRFSNFHVHR